MNKSKDELRITANGNAVVNFLYVLEVFVQHLAM